MDETQERELIDSIDKVLQPLAKSMIDDLKKVNKHLEYLDTLERIEIHPKDANKQRQTAAGKQYKEYLQQKTNIFKALCSLVSKKGTEEDSPLRAYLKSIERRNK